MNKKLLMLVPTGIIAVSLLVGGATYALFTSATANTSNTFKAGTVTLDLQRDNADSYPGPMFYSSTSDTNSTLPGKYAYDVAKADPQYRVGAETIGGWAPGDTAMRTLITKNVGSINANLTNISVDIPASYTSRLNQPINGVTSLSTGPDQEAYIKFIKNMKVTIKDSFNTELLVDVPLENLLNTGININPYPLGSSGAANALNFTIHMDSSPAGASIPDNVMQGKNIIVDFKFSASQSDRPHG